jgi:hypothetical protein
VDLAPGEAGQTEAAQGSGATPARWPSVGSERDETVKRRDAGGRIPGEGRTRRRVELSLARRSEQAGSGRSTAVAPRRGAGEPCGVEDGDRAEGEERRVAQAVEPAPRRSRTGSCDKARGPGLGFPGGGKGMRKRSTARSRTEVPKPGRAPGRPAGTDGVGGGCPDSTRRRRGPYVATTYVLVSSRREKPPPLAGGGETRQAPPPEESEGEAWKGGRRERGRHLGARCRRSQRPVGRVHRRALCSR